MKAVVDATRKVKLFCNEFGFAAGRLKGSLAEGRNKNMIYNNISDSAKIGNNVKFGQFITVGDNVKIGDNCIIESYSCIGYSNGRERSGLSIGKNAHIRSHSIVYLGSSIGENLVTGHHSIIRENCIVGDGFQLGSGSVLMGDLEIGNYVKTGSKVEIGQFSKVGNYVWIFINSSLLTDKHPPSMDIIGPTINDFAIVGAHCVVFPGVTVGKDCLLGSGCFLTKDLGDLTIAVGNPFRELGSVKKIKLEDGITSAYPWRYRYQNGYPIEIASSWLAEVKKIEDT
jgi:acetyltransferase-like isoleucine patch superfamily enzyme|tara:strand:- start:320 stop:1171 length:852 start_codon:yes stop_codon:yes gene_type:complete